MYVFLLIDTMVLKIVIYFVKSLAQRKMGKKWVHKRKRISTDFRISRCAASLRNYRQVDDEFGHALRSYVKSALDTAKKQPPSTREKTSKLLRKRITGALVSIWVNWKHVKWFDCWYQKYNKRREIQFSLLIRTFLERT